MTLFGVAILGLGKDLVSLLLLKRIKDQRQANQGMCRWTPRKRIFLLGWFVKRKADKQRAGLSWLQRKQAAMGAKAIRYMAKTNTLDDMSVLLSARAAKKAAPGRRAMEVDILL